MNTTNKILIAFCIAILLLLTPVTVKSYLLLNRVDTVLTEVEQALLFKTKEILKNVNSKELGKGQQME